MVYLNGIFKTTTTSDSYYNATNLTPDTNYWVGTYTVDAHGNVNTTWINQTASTQANNGAPIANFTYSPANPIINQTITFNASKSTDPDGSLVNYAWDFGGNSSADGVVAYHTYSVNTTYIVRLTVTDADGATNQTSANIQILTPCETYDTNGIPGIQQDEAVQAVNDYFDGLISEETVVAVILCYYELGG
jgi:chitodextrinase